MFPFSSSLTCSARRNRDCAHHCSLGFLGRLRVSTLGWDLPRSEASLINSSLIGYNKRGAPLVVVLPLGKANGRRPNNIVASDDDAWAYTRASFFSLVYTRGPRLEFRRNLSDIARVRTPPPCRIMGTPVKVGPAPGKAEKKAWDEGVDACYTFRLLFLFTLL